MSYVVGKMINGCGPYYYLVKTEKVNGKSKTTHLAYLGKNPGQKSGTATAATLNSITTKKQTVDLTGKADKAGAKASDFNKTQLNKGIKVEMDHTKDKNVAKQIAMDHLTESPDYYKELEKMEKKLDKKKQ